VHPVRAPLLRVLALALVAALSALPGARVGARDGEGLRLVICGAFGAFEVPAPGGSDDPAGGAPALCCLPPGALALPETPWSPPALLLRRGVATAARRAPARASDRPRRAHPPRAPPAA